MSEVARLRDAWVLAATAPVKSGLRAFRIRARAPVVWAVLDDTGRKGILIEAGAGELLGQAVGAANGVDAIAASILSFESDARASRGLLLTCIDSVLDEAFTAFSEALVTRCADGMEMPVAFRACLEEFRQLLLGRSTTPSDIGLLGELVALEELATLDAEADRLWAYPDLERHDFRNGAVAHEVKTTRRSRQQNPTVSISSLDQLSPPANGQLFLRFIRVERDPAGPVSADGLLRSLGNKLRDKGQGMFARVGTEQLASIRKESFTVLEHRTFLVRAGFPRLTSAELVGGKLAAGIGNVRYDLDLSGLQIYETPRQSANRALVAGSPV